MGELTRLLYSASDDAEENRSANESPLELDPITTPDKDCEETPMWKEEMNCEETPWCKEEMNCEETPMCEEEMNCSDDFAGSHSSADVAKPVEKTHQGHVKDDDQSRNLPSDDDFLRLLLNELDITFTFTTVPCLIDVASCLEKNAEGICVLSGLMKIDLVCAMDSLLNKVGDVSSLHARSTSFCRCASWRTPRSSPTTTPCSLSSRT